MDLSFFESVIAEFEADFVAWLVAGSPSARNCPTVSQLRQKIG